MRCYYIRNGQVGFTKTQILIESARLKKEVNKMTIKLDSLIKEMDELKKTDPMGTSQKAAVLRANLQSEYGANMFNLRTKLEKARLNLSSDNTKKRAV